MSTVMLEKLQLVQTGQPLVDQLYELQPADHESQAAFLGRAAIVADELADHRLTETELKYVTNFLGDWIFYSGRTADTHLGMARRLVTPSLEQTKKIGERAARGLITGDNGNIVIVFPVKYPAFRGEDIASVFKVAGLDEAMSHTPAITPPKPREQKCKENNTPTKRSVELDELPDFYVTESEQQVVRLIALPPGKITKEVRIAVATLYQRFNRAVDRNGGDRAIFLTKAVSKGMIDMSLLPPAEPYSLTAIEGSILSNYAFAEPDVTTEELELSSEDEVIDIWKSIYAKMNVSLLNRPHHHNSSNRTQAFLVALRDDKL
jgi:hypothetical protein